MRGKCSSIVKRVVRSTRVPDGGAIEAEDEVALPMTGYGPVVRFGGSLADEDLIGDKAFGACTSARPRDPECTTRAEACGELTPQGTPTLDEQCLVDRLMRYPHGRIIGEIELEPVGDLLGAPRHRPAPILASPVTTPHPAYLGPGEPHPVQLRHSACETVLHVLAQRSVCR